jgi:hypothetical protein
MKKHGHLLLIVFIIALTLSSSTIVTLADTYQSQTNPGYDNNERNTLTLYTIFPNKTIRATSTNLSDDQMNTFTHEIQNATTIDEQLSILEPYHLITTDSALNRLRTAIKQQETRLNGRAKNVWNSRNHFLYFNGPSLVHGMGVGYYEPSLLFIPLGTSLITWWLNTNEYSIIPSFDLADHVIGEFEFHSKGPVHSFGGDFIGFLKMVGFVGIVYHAAGRHGYFGQGFYGFALYVRAFGKLYPYA